MKTIDNFKKKFLLFILIAGFIYHWTAIAVGVTSSNALKNQVDWLFRDYYRSFFWQQWQLFGPDPSKFSKKILLKCHSKKPGDSDWIDLLKDDLNTHQTFRFTHHGRKIRIPISIGRAIVNLHLKLTKKMGCKKLSLKCLKDAEPKLRTSRAWKLAKNYSKNKCRNINRHSTAFRLQVRQDFINKPGSTAQNRKYIYVFEKDFFDE